VNRKIVYSALTVIILASVFISWYYFTYLRPLKLSEDFESGLGEWIADGDIPLDPNNPGHTMQWNITRVTDAAKSGQYSVKLFIDGSQDDGTIWIERRIVVKRNSQVQVKVSFQFYSDQESFNTIAAIVAYAGVRNPETEGDFAVVGQANEVAGWKQYSETLPLNTGSGEELWVAVGISVRWETHLTYLIDDVEIEVQ